MAYDAALADRVRQILSDRRDVEEKHMFGGVAFMIRGHMACGVSKDRLMVRLDGDEADGLLAEPGVGPMDFTGKPMRGFLFVEPGGFGSDAALRAWVDRCVGFAESKPVKPPKTGHARRG